MKYLPWRRKSKKKDVNETIRSGLHHIQTLQAILEFTVRVSISRLSVIYRMRRHNIYNCRTTNCERNYTRNGGDRQIDRQTL